MMTLPLQCLTKQDRRAKSTRKPYTLLLQLQIAFGDKKMKIPAPLSVLLAALHCGLAFGETSIPTIFIDLASGGTGTGNRVLSFVQTNLLDEGDCKELWSVSRVKSAPDVAKVIANSEKRIQCTS